MINKYLVAILILGFVFFYTSKHTTRKDIPVSIVVPVVNTPKESIVYTDYKEALEIAKKEKERFVIISADQALEQVFSQAVFYLEKFLKVS